MSASPGTAPLRFGIVGFGWMGQVHAKAMTRGCSQHYPELGVRPQVVAVADPATTAASTTPATCFGVSFTTADWRQRGRARRRRRRVRRRSELHPPRRRRGGGSGRQAPLGREAGRAQPGRDRGDRRTRSRLPAVASAVGFNYRNAPAVELARELVASGRIGEVRHVRVQMLGDYCAHPDGALTWRFVRELGRQWGHRRPRLARARPGAVRRRPDRRSPGRRHRRSSPNGRRPIGAASHFSRGGGGPLLPVENEDHVVALLRFADGARGVLEASRASVGEQNAYELRGARQHRRAGLGLPADGRAAGLPGPGLPGGLVVDALHRAG